MRDLEKRPYSIDEKRVAEWWATKVGIGGGDDPIGCLIVSHECLAADRKELRERLRRIKLATTCESLSAFGYQQVLAEISKLCDDDDFEQDSQAAA